MSKRLIAVVTALCSTLLMLAPAATAGTGGETKPPPKRTPKVVKDKDLPELKLELKPTDKKGTKQEVEIPEKAKALADDFPSSWVRMVFFVRGYHFVMDAQSQGGHGAPIQLWDYNQSAAEIFVREPAAEGGGFLHPLYNRWLCLGTTGPGAGGYLEIQDCNGTQGQRWRLYGSAPGLTMRPDWDRGLCADVRYSEFQAGTRIWLWGCHGGGSQEFRRGYCWERECEGHDASWTGCNVGAQTVAEDTFGGIDRLEVRNSDTCRSRWGRMTVASTIWWGKVLRFWEVSPTQARYFIVEIEADPPHQTKSTAMFGVMDSWQYFSCAYDDPNLGTGELIGCTPTV